MRKNALSLAHRSFAGVFFCAAVVLNGQSENTRIISENGYDNCIELSNRDVRVVLDPNVGGRVLIYKLNPHSRFSLGYIIHGPGNVMDFRPEPEKNVRVRKMLHEMN